MGVRAGIEKFCTLCNVDKLDILKYSLLLIRQPAILSAQIFAACVPPLLAPPYFLSIGWHLIVLSIDIYTADCKLNKLKGLSTG